MNIIMNADMHVFTGVEAVICSTMKTTSKSINWFIFTGYLEWHNNILNPISLEKDYLTKLVKSYDKDSTITFIDCTEYYLIFSRNNINKYSWNPYACLRLFSDLFLPVGKYLYIDADALVLKDISNFEEFIEDDCDLCIRKSKINELGNYDFCSNLLGFNLVNIKKDGFLERSRNLFKTVLYKYPDQEAMQNAKGSICFYPKDYNVSDYETEDTIKNAYIRLTELKIYTGLYCRVLNKQWKHGEEFTYEKEFWKFYNEYNYIQEEILKKRKELNFIFNKDNFKPFKSLNYN